MVLKANLPDPDGLSDGLVLLTSQLPHLRLSGAPLTAGTVTSPTPAPESAARPGCQRSSTATQVPAKAEHQVAPHRIGAVFLHQIIRGNDIAPTLTHLFAVFAQDGALIVETDHGFITGDHAHVPHGLGEEARVEQMHGGMFNAASILIYGSQYAPSWGS